MTDIPIVDFWPMSLQNPNCGQDESELRHLADDIVNSFKTIGFVYLKNHGIAKKKLDDVHGISDKFFTQSMETKRKYVRKDDSNHGWVSLELESLNPERPGDLKEAYNVTPQKAKIWPDEDVPGFQKAVMDFFELCGLLSLRVLEAIGIGLNLEDPKHLVKCHNLKTMSNVTTLRCLYYPPLPNDTDIKENQIRCGEHSDYGSITLLFQDDIGGLQVKTKEGIYHPATPIPDTVLVNVGDLMQRWTTDLLVSTKHRVLIPAEEAKKRQVRRSVAFFAHPDNDCVISCLDGSTKYEPITSWDYLLTRFSKTY